MPAPDATDQAQSGYKNEVTVLGETLKEGETMPEVGDEVELQVKGKVARISGDTVCVTPTEVNGEPAPPVPPDEAEATDNSQEEPMDAQRERLRAGAMADDQSGY